MKVQDERLKRDEAYNGCNLRGLQAANGYNKPVDLKSTVYE